MVLKSTPDVQLGKIFIVLWIGFMLFIVISILVVYFNAKKETSSCEAGVINVEKSKKESSMGRTAKMFIAFLAITAFAVSTMNLTYKINHFEKIGVKPEKQQSSPNILNFIKKQQSSPSLAETTTTTTNMSQSNDT